MDIEYSKEGILDRVKMTVSLVARDLGERYAQVAVTERDADSLDAVFDVSLGRLLRQLRVVNATKAEDGVIAVDTPNIDIEKVQSQLVTLVGDYLSNYVSGYWFRTKNVEQGNAFLLYADESLNDIRRIILVKDAPIKKLYGDGGKFTYAIVTGGDLAIGDKRLSVGVTLTYASGKTEKLSLFDARYTFGVILTGDMDGEEVKANYEEGEVCGFVAGANGILTLLLHKGKEEVARTTVNVV